MKSTELISRDHAILRRGLDILDGMVKKLEDGERVEIADAIALLKFLRIFGDRQEDSLHPLFREHSEERAIVGKIEAALNAKRGIDFVQNSRRLSLLVRNHLDKADSVLSGIADRSLSKEDDAMVPAEFTKNRAQEETLINFPRLENIYVREPKKTPFKSGREAARAQGAGSYT